MSDLHEARRDRAWLMERSFRGGQSCGSISSHFLDSANVFVKEKTDQAP